MSMSDSDERAILLEEAVREVLGGITAREAKVVRMIMGIDSNQGQNLIGRQMLVQRVVASQLELSQPGVSVIYRRALRKLKHPTRSNYLRPFHETIEPNNITCREEVLLLEIFGY